MPKRSKGLSPGVRWVPGKEGWVPRFIWRTIVVEGPPRPAMAYLPGEPFRVVMEFACLAGVAIFGVSPYHTVTEDGREVFKTNPEFDEIPDMSSILGGLSDPSNIEIRNQPESSSKTESGVPMDQIDPSTMPSE